MSLFRMTPPGRTVPGLWIATALAAALGLSLGCDSAAEAPDNLGPPELPVSADEIEEALEAVSMEDVVRHVRVLASDAYGGRAPTSPGEEKTIEYLKEQFAALGLEPGGTGGTWVQEVPLVSMTADPAMTLTVSGGGQSRAFEYGPDFIAWTTRVVDEVTVADAPLVFVGYGIVAPEYGWNDYQGMDVEGKTVVVLVNDPGFATQDEALFRGNAMTYYGRWTYKYEEAARQGAAGVLLVHETAPASYGWATVQNSWSGPQFDLVADDDNMSRLPFESWISQETARAIFAQAGMDYEAMKGAARTRDFQAAPLDGLTASIRIRNKIRRSTSDNFLARLPGSERPQEVILYMGHWDHLGTDPGLKGDSIFNGAVDNASGIAALLELAQAFTTLEPAPERSIVFLGTTAEEQGLLGSDYYARNPVYPLEQTVAAINIDALSIFGPMNDFVVVGYGNSELDDYARWAARDQGRVVKPNPHPERGSFYRSDHFPLAREGVPALYGHAGLDHEERGEEWARQRSEAWTAGHYHQVTDEYDESWDLRGAVEDIALWFRVGLYLAYTDDFPEWNEGTEFRAARDRMMAERDAAEY